MLPNPRFRTVLSTLAVFLCFLVLDLGFRFLYSLATCRPWNNTQALFFTLCWSGLLTALLALLPALLRRILTVVLVVAACLVALVHAVLYNLTGNYLSLADLSFAGEGARFFDPAYLHFRIGLVILVLLVLALGIAAACLIPKSRYRWYRPVIAVAVIGVCCLGIWLQDRAMRESDSKQISWSSSVYDPTSDEAVYTNFSDINRCMHMCGSYQYLCRNFLVANGLEDLLENGRSYSTLNDYYSSKPAHQDNDWTGKFADKNLLLIQLESIDTWMLTEEYMPNLYHLQQQSVDWTDNYTPLFSSAATFNTELIVNTGLVLPPTGIASKAYTAYPLPYSLPHLFVNAGYRCETFHPSRGFVYNRMYIHGNWGYSVYHDFESMGMDDYMRDSQMIRAYEDMVSDSPFLSFIITYSGHGPYNESMDNICEGHWDDVQALINPDELPGTEADKQEYIRAIAHARETDDFIGELLARLEADGHINDTVLFFYTDHYNKYMTDTELVMKLKGATNADELMKTPCFFYFRGLEPGTVDKAASSLDVLPTIANLFDLNTDYRYYAGQDVFSEGPGLVMFRNYDWYDGTTLFTAGSADSADNAQTTARVHEILDNTWSTLKCNYFDYLKHAEAD